MKNSKRWIALTAALLMSVSSVGVFAGCDEETEENSYDPTKANLSVATYDGGVGKEWLEKAAARFMETHKDSTHFQEGRTGVKISVDANKVDYKGGKLAEGTLRKDMYFTEGVEYYEFYKKGMVADLTEDVVKASMADYGEGVKTIEDKLDPSFKKFLTEGTGGKYYMLPFYSGFYGIMYDIDLFEEAGFYFDQDGDLGLRLVEGVNASKEDRDEFEAAKSNGPDGEHGTYDDGLPETYEELIKLADYIKGSGNYVPFCYSGAVSDYVSKAFRSFIADYEGYDAYNLNYTLKGENVAVVDKVNDDGSIVMGTVDITKDNAYELQRQAGKYYSLLMQEKLFGSTAYIGEEFNGLDYTGAQSEFIKSKHTTKRYAMLLEGVWWENEASNAFDDLVTLYGKEEGERRFGMLPIPKVNADVKDRTQTMVSSNSSFGFINKNCENMELAKEFMRFLHTDSEMSKFTAETSIPRSLKYTVLEGDKGNATAFGQSVIDMVSSANIVYPYSTVDLVLNNAERFEESAWFFTANVGGKTLNNPFTAFTSDSNKVSAKDYFNGLYTYQKETWPIK